MKLKGKILFVALLCASCGRTSDDFEIHSSSSGTTGMDETGFDIQAVPVPDVGEDAVGDETGSGGGTSGCCAPDGCAPGSLGCKCFPDNTCYDGLECGGNPDMPTCEKPFNPCPFPNQGYGCPCYPEDINGWCLDGYECVQVGDPNDDAELWVCGGPAN